MDDTRLIFFDCDSTLSSIEGVDELARLRGPKVYDAVEAMTREAMEGRVGLDQVFSRRLELIRPCSADLEALGRRYIETVEPEAELTLAHLRREGWRPVILSGGFRAAILPLASRLGVERVEAVDLWFDEDGGYRDFDRSFPTAHGGGKERLIRQIREESGARLAVLVGDGASDLEAKPAVDLFVGFGRYAVREAVRNGADAFITELSSLLPLLHRLVAGPER